MNCLIYTAGQNGRFRQIAIVAALGLAVAFEEIDAYLALKQAEWEDEQAMLAQEPADDDDQIAAEEEKREAEYRRQLRSDGFHECPAGSDSWVKRSFPCSCCENEEWELTEEVATRVAASLRKKYPQCTEDQIQTYLALYSDGYPNAQCLVQAGLSDPEEQGLWVGEGEG